MASVKIGITGSHSTGKTTFLNQISQQLSESGLRVGRVDDLAGAAMRAGFPILREHCFASTAWIIARGIQLELEQCRINDVVLVDRPALDALAYLRAALKTRQEQMDEAEQRYIESLTRLHMPTYNLVIRSVLDSSIPVEAIKGRDLDEGYRALVDNEIESLILELGLEALELWRDGRSEVAENVIMTIHRQTGINIS